MSRAIIPNEKQISDILSATLPKKVTARKANQSASIKSPVTAVYTDESDSAVSLCICNIKLAACMGAALTLVPASAALESANNNDLSEMVFDSMHEVLNIMSGIFRAPESKGRVFLKQIYMPDQSLPDDIAASIKEPAEQISFDVAIDSYITESMTLMVL